MIIRLSSDQQQRVQSQAAVQGVDAEQLALRYLEEGLRTAEHPLVYFMDGPAGRRASLRGSGDVWEVIATVQDNRGDIRAAAAYLGIPVALVEAAFSYYEEFPDEIDERLRLEAQAPL